MQTIQVRPDQGVGRISCYSYTFKFTLMQLIFQVEGFTTLSFTYYSKSY